MSTTQQPLPVGCRTKRVAEVAQIIGVEYETVLRLIKREQLAAIWVGNRYLVPDHAIRAFLGEPEPDTASDRAAASATAAATP